MSFYNYTMYMNSQGPGTSWSSQVLLGCGEFLNKTLLHFFTGADLVLISLEPPMSETMSVHLPFTFNSVSELLIRIPAQHL